MPKIELDGLPVIEATESETITVAVSADDTQSGDTKNPERQRGKRWYRYEPPQPVQS